jgi:hypothetical protein
MSSIEQPNLGTNFSVVSGIFFHMLLKRVKTVFVRFFVILIGKISLPPKKRSRACGYVGEGWTTGGQLLGQSVINTCVVHRAIPLGLYMGRA